MDRLGKADRLFETRFDRTGKGFSDTANRRRFGRRMDDERATGRGAVRER